MVQKHNQVPLQWIDGLEIENYEVYDDGEGGGEGVSGDDDVEGKKVNAKKNRSIVWQKELRLLVRFRD